jgi:hypothetical protein
MDEKREGSKAVKQAKIKENITKAKVWNKYEICRHTDLALRAEALQVNAKYARDRKEIEKRKS